MWMPGDRGDAQGAAIEASSSDVWQCVGANVAAVERAGVLPLRVRVCMAQVRQLSELSQVNERCLELQRNKASSSSKRRGAAAEGAGAAALTSSVVEFSGAPRPRQQQQRQRQRSSRKAAGCPFLSVEGGAAAWSEFKDLVLETPMDVEELASLGRKMKVCVWCLVFVPAVAMRLREPLVRCVCAHKRHPARGVLLGRRCEEQRPACVLEASVMRSSGHCWAVQMLVCVPEAAPACCCCRRPCRSAPTTARGVLYQVLTWCWRPTVLC